MGREKGNKMTVSDCCFICLLSYARYICMSGKLQAQTVLFSFNTHGQISHCDVCFTEQ